MEREKMVPLAINGGIGFGAKLNQKQLIELAKHLDEDTELEITTFQQLYIEIPESKLEVTKKELENVGFSCYPVGPYVKSLRTCNFCQGAEEEGMPIAIELNKRIAGQEVPFPLRPAYTGCPNACGEPLINDIGIIKRHEKYDLYIGGQAKGQDARIGQLFKEQLEPDLLYKVVDRLIQTYRENGKKREKFPKFTVRFGLDKLKQNCLEDIEQKK